MALPGSVSLVAAEADGEDPAIGTFTAMTTPALAAGSSLVPSDSPREPSPIG